MEVFLPALRLSLLSSMVLFCYTRGCMPCCKAFLPEEASSLGKLTGSVLWCLRDTRGFLDGGNAQTAQESGKDLI